MNQARKDWHHSVKVAKAKRFFIIDEKWFSTTTTKPRGYASRGKKLVSRVPHGHWKPTTFVGDITKSGIVAPMLLDGPINSDSFKVYIEQVLAPVIRPGDLVVLDNLSSLKTAIVSKTIVDNGIRTKCQPPYSPDLNPIENAFSKLKALVKSAGQWTISGLWRIVGQLIDLFSSEEYPNYFSHCGYDSKPICKAL